MRLLGTFLPDPLDVPAEVFAYLAGPARDRRHLVLGHVRRAGETPHGVRLRDPARVRSRLPDRQAVEHEGVATRRRIEEVRGAASPSIGPEGPVSLPRDSSETGAPRLAGVALCRAGRSCDRPTAGLPADPAAAAVGRRGDTRGDAGKVRGIGLSRGRTPEESLSRPGARDARMRPLRDSRADATRIRIDNAQEEDGRELRISSPSVDGGAVRCRSLTQFSQRIQPRRRARSSAKRAPSRARSTSSPAQPRAASRQRQPWWRRARAHGPLIHHLARQEHMLQQRTQQAIRRGRR
jgi:hypothetical protein